MLGSCPNGRGKPRGNGHNLIGLGQVAFSAENADVVGGEAGTALGVGDVVVKMQVLLFPAEDTATFIAGPSL